MKVFALLSSYYNASSSPAGIKVTCKVHPRGQLAANAMSIYVDRSEQETLQTASTYTTVTRATGRVAMKAGYEVSAKTHDGFTRKFATRDFFFFNHGPNHSQKATQIAN